eukprot:COSAG01_NODE_20066_length_973_cov_0.589245_1_plen_92_part_01
MQVPAVSSTGRTQWQPSSSFTPPAELEPEPEPEPEPELEQGTDSAQSPQEDEDSDDDMFASFASKYHQQVKQVSPNGSPEKDTAVQASAEHS